MDNTPLAYVLDPTLRLYARQMPFEEAVALCEANEARRESGIYGPAKDSVAEGIYTATDGRPYLLHCVSWPGGFRCWYGSLGMTIAGVIGTTPAEAIERAQALCC
jgi:hypothetical protein